MKEKTAQLAVNTVVVTNAEAKELDLSGIKYIEEGFDMIRISQKAAKCQPQNYK